MKLAACRKCKKEVARNAWKCPHCGVSEPSMGVKEFLAGLGVLAAIVAGVAMWWPDSDEEKAAKGAALDQRQAEEDAKCNKDLACIGNKLVGSAGVYCKKDIQRLAKHSVRWTDGTLEPKFSMFRWGSKDSTIVTMLGDKVQFQNGFGAYTDMIYECDFEVTTRLPLGVRVREGVL